VVTPFERARETGLPDTIEAVVVGVSVGAVEALSELLPALPAATPWPILIVVHLPPQKPSLLAALFARKCSLPVREPEDKQAVAAGIWIAPPDYHLLVETTRSFAFSADSPVNYCRPSVDVLFESAADAYGAGLVGVVLTGANGDGAEGALAIRQAGGFVIVEDPTTAEAAMMPTRAIERGRPQWVATLPEISEALRGAAIANGQR
jgi:two-component system, chemotaxis family, protein-glutamate methylesterase/glutaminase